LRQKEEGGGRTSTEVLLISVARGKKEKKRSYYKKKGRNIIGDIRDRCISSSEKKGGKRDNGPILLQEMGKEKKGQYLASNIRRRGRDHSPLFHKTFGK